VTALLDANVLIALLDVGHVHHQAAERWLTSDDEATFATCPITQGALVRHLLRAGSGAASATEVLDSLGGHPRHEFWEDHLPFVDVSLRGVIGHRQVTDAYLAALARDHRGRLVTLDAGLAALHADVATLLEP